MSNARTIAMLAAALCFACDDDDDERPRYRAEIDVDVSSPVSSLDEPNLERICRSFDAYVDTHVNWGEIAFVTCLPAAIVFGQSERDCEQRLDACMAAFPEPLDVQARLRDSEVCYDSLAGCRASVAELEGCINLSLDLVFEIIDGWSCGDSADADLRADAARAMDSAMLCADVDAACRDFATFRGPD